MRSTKSRKSRRRSRIAVNLLRQHRQRLRRAREHKAFDLHAIIGREASEPDRPQPSWPSEDIAFLAAVLRAQHVGELLVQRVTAQIPPGGPGASVLAERLAEALAISFDYAPLEDILRARTLLLAGPHGAGKTTLAGKLAARLSPKRVRLISIDTAMGAAAQLADYAGAIGLSLEEASSPAALQEMLAASEPGPSILDSGGIDPADAQAWESLRPWIAAAEATPLLVLPANILIEDALAAARAFRALGGRHVIATRFDIVRRVGGLLSVTVEGLALAAVSVTPHFAYGLRPLTPAILARRLLAGALDDERWQAPAA